MNYLTVTVLHPSTTTDEYNNPVPDWDDPDEFDVSGCLYEPVGSEEARDGGQSVRVDGKLYCPAGAPIVHLDRIEIGSDTYEVHGVPAVWGTAGIVVELVRVAGSEEGAGS